MAAMDCNQRAARQGGTGLPVFRITSACVLCSVAGACLVDWVEAIGDTSLAMSRAVKCKLVTGEHGRARATRFAEFCWMIDNAEIIGVLLNSV